MKRALGLVAIAVTLVGAFHGPASAGLTQNGLSSNGLSSNGVTGNGTDTRGQSADVAGEAGRTESPGATVITIEVPVQEATQR